MFAPALTQLLGATVLLSGSDRLPPRAALTTVSYTAALTTALLAVPGLPVPALLGLVLLQGLISSLAGGVRWGLLHEIVPNGSYLQGRSLFNMTSGLTQIAGYATAGALLTWLAPGTCLLLAAALCLASALTQRLGLTARPPRATGRPSPAATWRGNSLLWKDRSRRLLLLGLWLPNGLVVGCESLYVSYAPESAGALFACAALGMFLGDVLVGRLLSPASRTRLATPLLTLLAAPYVLFVAQPPLYLALLCVTLASVGFGASLVQQEHLMALTPKELTGHALGLHSAGMLGTQGVSAVLAGTLAQLSSPAWGMTVMAGASLAVTGALWACGRPAHRSERAFRSA